MDVLANTEELLSLAGYETITALNGIEGLEKARNEQPDLVLCDILMPRLDGYGVLQAFQTISELKEVPFVFMTAKSQRSDFRTGMDLGADDYLTKPFTGEELLKVVTSRLKKKHSYKSPTKGMIALAEYVRNKEVGFQKLSEQYAKKTLFTKQNLYLEGEQPYYLYLITSGKIKQLKSNEAGKDYMLNIYKKGDFLAFSELIQNTHHNENAIAIETTEVLMIGKDDFLKLIQTEVHVVVKFFKNISQSVLETSDRFLKIVYDSARKRVADAILFAADKYQEAEDGGLNFILLRENISALSCLSPETVSRNLTEFRAEGLIEIRNGFICILNLKKLREVKD